MQAEVTQILNAIEAGDPKAAEELLPLVYEELRRLAASKMSRESAGQTLQATALVHEAYVRLVGDDSSRWDNRGHFFAAAGEAMRRILIENVRRKMRLKRGGQWNRTDLEVDELAGPARAEELLALDDALTALGEMDPPAAELVKLRYFVGLSHQEAAAVLNLPRRTADRLWAFARAWLYRQVGPEQESAPRE